MDPVSGSFSSVALASASSSVTCGGSVEVEPSDWVIEDSPVSVVVGILVSSSEIGVGESFEPDA